MEIEMIIECPKCHGTGVYVGIAERDGAAVICYKCEGSGAYKYKYEYKEFNGIKKRNDVKRVYKDCYGFIINPNILKIEGIGDVDMGKEGVSYDEFLKGDMPEHTKSLACPLLADQPACHNIKGFIEECDRLSGRNNWGQPINKCPYRNKKENCWKRFEDCKNGKNISVL